MATRTCRTCEADGETASRSKYSTVSKTQWGVVWQRFSLKQMHRHVLNSRLPSLAVNRKSAMNIKAKDHQGLKSPISQTHVCLHVPCDRESRFSFRTQLWLSRLCLCSRLALGRTTLMSQSGWTLTLRPLSPPSKSTTRTTCSIRANRYTDEPALSENSGWSIIQQYLLECQISQPSILVIEGCQQLIRAEFMEQWNKWLHPACNIIQIYSALWYSLILKGKTWNYIIFPKNALKDLLLGVSQSSKRSCLLLLVQLKT